MRAFLQYLSSDGVNLKPVWCCVDKETEKYLAVELGWSAVIAVAEERLNPIEVDPANNDKTVRRKIHRAERDGVKVVEIEGKPDDETRARIEERCKEWSANRRGTQIHLTGVRPFDDMVHRKYFYAVDKNGKVGIVLVPSACLCLLYSELDLCTRRSRSTCRYPWLPNQVGPRVPWCTSRSHRVHFSSCHQETW